MEKATFRSKLEELLAQVEDLPEANRGQIKILAKETLERHQQLCVGLDSLQELLDTLRLSVKYLMFDLEATQRELYTAQCWGNDLVAEKTELSKALVVLSENNAELVIENQRLRHKLLGETSEEEET